MEIIRLIFLANESNVICCWKFYNLKIYDIVQLKIYCQHSLLWFESLNSRVLQMYLVYQRLSEYILTITKHLDLLQVNPKLLLFLESSLALSQEKLIQLEPRHWVLNKLALKHIEANRLFLCKRRHKPGWWPNGLMVSNESVEYCRHFELFFNSFLQKTWLMGSSTMVLPVHSSFTNLGCRGWATDPFTWVEFRSVFGNGFRLS